MWYWDYFRTRSTHIRGGDLWLPEAHTRGREQVHRQLSRTYPEDIDHPLVHRPKYLNITIFPIGIVLLN